MISQLLREELELLLAEVESDLLSVPDVSEDLVARASKAMARARDAIQSAIPFEMLLSYREMHTILVTIPAPPEEKETIQECL